MHPCIGLHRQRTLFEDTRNFQQRLSAPLSTNIHDQHQAQTHYERRDYSQPLFGLQSSIMHKFGPHPERSNRCIPDTITPTIRFLSGDVCGRRWCAAVVPPKLRGRLQPKRLCKAGIQRRASATRGGGQTYERAALNT